MAHELRRIYTEAFPTATDAIITLLDHQGNEIKAWFNKHFLAHEDGHENVSHDELRDAIDAAIDPLVSRLRELERRLLPSGSPPPEPAVLPYHLLVVHGDVTYLRNEFRRLSMLVQKLEASNEHLEKELVHHRTMTQTTYLSQRRMSALNRELVLHSHRKSGFVIRSGAAKLSLATMGSDPRLSSSPTPPLRPASPLTESHIPVAPPLPAPRPSAVLPPLAIPPLPPPVPALPSAGEGIAVAMVQQPLKRARTASYAAPAGSPRASEDQLSDAEDAYARGYDRTPSPSPPSPTPSASTTPMSDDEEAATFTDPEDSPCGDPSV